MSYAAITQISRHRFFYTRLSAKRRKFAKKASTRRFRQAARLDPVNAPTRLPYSYWADIEY
jgi:hypothetical protein